MKNLILRGHCPERIFEDLRFNFGVNPHLKVSLLDTPNCALVDGITKPFTVQPRNLAIVSNLKSC